MDAIIINGAPYITGLNGSFYIVDPSKTTVYRMWANAGSLRIYYENGWKLADATTGTVYFYQAEPSEVDPWSVTAWSTDIAAYAAYTTSLQLTRTDDAETTTKSTSVRTDYVLTTDTVFLAGKTYYTRTGAGTAASPYRYEEATVEAGKAVPSNTYYEPVPVTVETVTTSNARTGKVTVKVTEYLSKTATDISIHTRECPPEISVGKVYRFSFVKDFRPLGYIKPTAEDYNDGTSAENDSDITRGIYTVDSSTTYYSLIMNGIDIYQNLYLPLGLSKELYELDRKSWMDNDVWYRLINPMLPSKEIYVPTSIIEGVPDGNVAEYNRYHLVTDIGIFNDPELLSQLVTCINMLFKAHFGIPTASELASYDSVWIPTSYAEWMNEKRKQNIVDFMTEKGEQYYTTLFKTEYNQLLKENSTLQTKVKTYEELLSQG